MYKAGYFAFKIGGGGDKERKLNEKFVKSQFS